MIDSKLQTYEYNNKIDLPFNESYRHLFIADTHFGDEGLFRFFRRPFQNVNEMDIFILQFLEDLYLLYSSEDTLFLTNTDDSKKEKGKVILWVVGDFAHDMASKEYVQSILNRLKFFDKIYLIRGNHDLLTDKEYLDAGFDGVYDSVFLEANNEIFSNVCMIHDPACYNPFVSYNETLIHGHIHYASLYKNTNIKGYESNVTNVSIEPWFYSLIKLIKSVFCHWSTYCFVSVRHVKSRFLLYVSNT
jgi:calcineurin-like phosphoesterase family protein